MNFLAFKFIKELIMEKEEFVSIPKDLLRDFVEDSATLRALEAGGVDNWDGYEECDSRRTKR